MDAKAIAALASAQEEIAGLKDARREERMGWIVVSVMLFDWAIMMNASNATAPIIVGLLQIALLTFLARRLGVEEFYALFARAMQRMSSMAAGKDD